MCTHEIHHPKFYRIAYGMIWKEHIYKMSEAMYYRTTMHIVSLVQKTPSLTVQIPLHRLLQRRQ